MKRNRKNIDKKKCKNRAIRNILLTFLVLGICLGGNYLANQNVFITHYEVANESLPLNFDGFRIVQVTDVHSIRSQEQADLFYEKIVGERPDAVVITGD